MASSHFPSVAVDVSATGALGGDGTPADPLEVLVDGVTVTIVDNTLHAPSGGGGTIGGDTGATDNRVIRSNGTGGSTIQGSTVGLSDLGIMAFAANAGLSFDGPLGAITIIGGDDGFGDSGLTIDGGDYLHITTVGYTDIDNAGDTIALTAFEAVIFDAPSSAFAIHPPSSGVAFDAVTTATADQTGTLIGLEIQAIAPPTNTLSEVIAHSARAVIHGNVSSIAYGSEGIIYGSGTAHVSRVVGQYGQVSAGADAGDAIVYDEADVFYGAVNVTGSGSSIGLLHGFWFPDFAPIGATNAYYNWNDSRGVYAIKEEFSQAVPRLYNPLFTKYTPGAVDYERIIERFGITDTYGTSNNAYFGAEAGGTGTLRALNLLGNGISAMSVPGTLTSFTAAAGSFTSMTVNGGAVLPSLSGTTGSIGGSFLASPGTTVTGTVTVAGAVVGAPVAVSASDGTSPNGLVVLSASVTSTNTVTVQLSALAAVTPTAKTYNVRVIQ